MNKKGAHVGMILSFLIFITFIAFLFSITQPITQVSQDKLNTLEFLKIELLEVFSEDLITITIKLSNLETSCIVFSGEAFEEVGGLNATAKFISEEGQEEIFPLGSQVENDGSTIVFNGPRENKLKIYYSNQFKQEDEPCPPSTWTYLTMGPENDYEITLFRTTEQIFESKINETGERINGNKTYYEELKKELGLSFGDEFGFSFYDEDGKEIIKANDKDVNANIYSDELPIQYIDDQANIKPGFLNIRVW